MGGAVVAKSSNIGSNRDARPGYSIQAGVFTLTTMPRDKSPDDILRENAVPPKDPFGTQRAEELARSSGGVTLRVTA